MIVELGVDRIPRSFSRSLSIFFCCWSWGAWISNFTKALEILGVMCGLLFRLTAIFLLPWNMTVISVLQFQQQPVKLPLAFNFLFLIKKRRTPQWHRFHCWVLIFLTDPAILPHGDLTDSLLICPLPLSLSLLQTMLTAISMSAVATNGVVPGGWADANTTSSSLFESSWF